MTRFRVAALPLAVGVVAASAISALAAPIVDQSNYPGQNFFFPLGPTFVPGQNTAELAQTFTVGQQGQLTSVSVDLLVQFDATFTLSIVPVVAGVPDTTGTPLATTTIGIPSGTAFRNFDISSANLNVNIGDQLAFWVTGDFARWIGSNGDSYGGGSAFWRFPGATDGSPTDWASPNSDVYFETYVLVPSPGAAVMLGAAGLAALGRRRRRA